MEKITEFTDRMIRAAMLDLKLYEEVEADAGLTGQAMWVVVLSSIAAGIGTIGANSISVIVMGTAVALIGWYLWAYLAYYIGTRFLPEPQTNADLGQMLRTIGFSSSPGLIRVAGGIPVIGNTALVIASVWMLVAMIIAIRQALDYTSTWRAVGVCVVGWLIQTMVLALLIILIKGTGG